MRAKDFLSRAYLLDVRIKAKEEQLQAAHEMARKATSAMDALRVSGTTSKSKLEDNVVKALSLEEAIEESRSELIETKAEIMETISRVPDVTHRTLLELRYLNFMRWDKIEREMNYSHSGIMILHRKSLQEIENILTAKSVHNCT